MLIIDVAEVALGKLDASGRMIPKILLNKTHTLKSRFNNKRHWDLTQKIFQKCLMNQKLKVTNWGTLKIDYNTMMTSRRGSFCCRRYC